MYSLPSPRAAQVTALSKPSAGSSGAVALAWANLVRVTSTGKPLSLKTIRHYIRAATAVLRWAHDQEWIDRMPAVPKLPKPMRQARDLDGTRIGSTFETFTGKAKRTGHIFRFILATGCRLSEACKLEWEHVHLDRGLCILPEHKTAESSGRPRSIYLTPDALAVLTELADERRLSVVPLSGIVFRNGKGEAYKPSGLRSILRRHAGGATPYQLRHTFCQTGSDGGTPIEVMAKLMGHASTETTAFYYEVRDARAVEAAKGMSIKATKAG